jgi:hypothetical protein
MSNVFLDYQFLSTFHCPLFFNSGPYSIDWEGTWRVKAINAFQSLKVSSMTPPLLIHIIPFLTFFVETNVFGFAVGAIVS